MREARADILVLHGQLEPRFGAGRCPSSGGILRHFTHLHAASVGPRFSTVAIANPDRGGAQLRRCVRRENQGSGKKTSEQSHASEAKSARERLGAAEDVHRPSLQARPNKTDSAGSLEILLPGSCNSVDEVSRERRGRASRISFGEFQTGLEGRIWGGVGNPLIQASIC